VKIAVDFDGTVVKQDRPYADVVTPLEFVDGAKDGLLALKRANHLLLLWSGRASRALLLDPLLDPFVRAGVVDCDRRHWLESRAIHRARYDQMIEFVERELPGVFDAIDDGLAGKFSFDLVIDDKAMAMRGPATWARIARVYGETEPLYDAAVASGLLDRPVESLNLVPRGTLRAVLDQIHGEMVAAGVAHYWPTFELGQAGFWAADRATTINVPWFLANDELRALAQERYPWTWETVTKSIRHEVGHSVGYAFELWRRPDWQQVFGDFLAPYPKSQPAPVDPASTEWVNYVPGVEVGYSARHPDEAWAEAFGCWLDPSTDWRERYQAGTGARQKLDYVDGIAKDVLRGLPSNWDTGSPRKPRAAYSGQTVRQALGLPSSA